MKMHSRYRYMYDAATSVRLRAKNSAALTADTSGAEYTFDTLQGYWTEGEFADKTLAIVANVTELDLTTGDEKYVLNATTDNGVVIGTATVPSVGQYVILLDMDTVKLSDPDAESVSLDLDVDGTTPSIKFFAWIAPVQA